MLRHVLAPLSALALAGAPLAQTPPAAPLITEPEIDGQIVHAADVHMETAPFSDPDVGDEHLASDWEIWAVSPSERVWSALGMTGLEKTHIHLADGTFEGSLAGDDELAYDEDWRLRVRHGDQTGLWSAWSERTFRTGPRTEVFPLELADVTASPPPSWIDDAGEDVVLPLPGGEPAFLRVDAASGSVLLLVEGLDGSANEITNPPPLGEHVDVRIVVGAGGAPLLLARSRLVVTDEHGADEDIWLPSFDLAAGETAYLWVADNGSTYHGDAGQTEPDFSTLARSAPVPWRAAQPGYAVDVVASGFKLPVNIAFVPSPSSEPDAPLFYVTELYGSIQAVLRDGTVVPYATGLLNYDPGGAFPGTGEQGLSGIVVDPTTRDVIAAMLYDAGGPHYPKVVRFSSADGGRTAASETIVLDMPGESQGQSHFISSLSIGPDGNLYVHMGDGFDASTAQNLDSFRGKILRMDLDGAPLPDNPFYDAGDGIGATDYVWCLGVRNPFGGAWRALDQRLYEVENGPSRDRMAFFSPGKNLGWNGSNASMSVHAIYNWQPAHAPVNIAFVEPTRFGGSGFPAAKMHRAFVAESGPTWAKGQTALGKRIVEFEIDSTGSVVAGPTPLIEYDGTGRASVVGLAAGPDGLYFTDLYKDAGPGLLPTSPGANVLRVRWVGDAEFAADVQTGPVPLTVRFADLSDVPGAAQWRWSFGDGTQSFEREPTHVFEEPGVYTVRLDVSGEAGVATERKEAFVVAGDPGTGITAEYFAREDLGGPRLVRTEARIDHSFAFDAPDPTLPSDHFSARWSGAVLPYYAETYTFHLTHDDGARLWVDGALVIDAWETDGPVAHSAQVALTPEKHAIVLEYYEATDFAFVRLEWESAREPRTVIPTARLFPAGFAEFDALPPQGRAPLSVQLVDRSQVPGASAWRWDFGDGTQSTERHPTHVYATSGLYDVRLAVTGEHGEVALLREAAVRVNIAVPGGAPGGLAARYYDDADLTGPSVARLDPRVDFDWRGGSPDRAIGPDTFSARWTGRLLPQFSEAYRLFVTSDDGVRLWVDGELVIDEWHDQGGVEHSASVVFTAGVPRTIRLEYYENAGTASIRLEWRSPSQPRQVIPPERLLRQ